ncbi:MAG: GNAT family N-acetyltransferase [Deltaproteobacteria bacterium]|nr:GNAT family N-acetyltransferase [Deltaproteobacteria bacterium]
MVHTLAPRIRKFEPEDLREILEIEEHAFPKTPYPEEVFKYYGRKPGTIFIVAEIDCSVVGYLIMEKGGHIISTAVSPGQRRKGIGERLYRYAAGAAGQKLWLEVRSRNTGAISFYRSMGMKITGVSKNYYGDDDALIMVSED